VKIEAIFLFAALMGDILHILVFYTFYMKDAGIWDGGAIFGVGITAFLGLCRFCWLVEHRSALCL